MYKPTVRSVRRAYTQLNRLLFKEQLPASKNVNISIGSMKITWWAYCEHRNDQFRIRLLPRYPNRRLFIAILAHEMVHMWEYQNYSTMSHGPKFFRFKRIFERNGILLRRGYQHRDFH
jgi:hypothetical protein